MSPKPSESHLIPTEERLFEDTFRGTLGSLKRILLQYNPQQASSPSHSSRLSDHSQELINEEIRRTTTKMQHLQTRTNGDLKSYKIAAYSFLSAQLIDEIENILSKHVQIVFLLFFVLLFLSNLKIGFN